MTTSPTQLAQILSEPEIKKFWLGYFQGAFREQIQQQLLEIFDHAKQEKCINRSDLAYKIGRRPEQISRWLSSPCNLEADTISDLALSLGYVPRISFEPAETLIRSKNTNRPTRVTELLVAPPQSGASFEIVLATIKEAP